jgi:hypothetical protein
LLPLVQVACLKNGGTIAPFFGLFPPTCAPFLPRIRDGSHNAKLVVLRGLCVVILGALEGTPIRIRHPLRQRPLGKRRAVRLPPPRGFVAGRGVRGSVVVVRFDVEVRFNIHLSIAIAQVFDHDDRRGDGVTETVADGQRVVGMGSPLGQVPGGHGLTLPRT